MTKATDHIVCQCVLREYDLRERIKTIYETLKSKDYIDLSTYCRANRIYIEYLIYTLHYCVVALLYDYYEVICCILLDGP